MKETIKSDKINSLNSGYTEYGMYVAACFCLIWIICSFRLAPLLKTIANDGNAIALDAALDVIIDYLTAYEDDICPTTAGAPAPTPPFQTAYGLNLCTSVIDKAFSSTKQSSINK